MFRLLFKCSAVALSLFCFGVSSASGSPPVRQHSLAQFQIQTHAQVSKAKAFAISPPLRSMPHLDLPPIMRRVVGKHHYDTAQLKKLQAGLIRAGLLKQGVRKVKGALLRRKSVLDQILGVRDPVVHGSALPSQNSTSPTITENFDGLGDSTGFPIEVTPPSADVAAGINNIVEIVNGSYGSVFQVYGKSGNAIGDPVMLSNLWSSMRGDCSNDNYTLGNGVVLFDQLADRYVITQLAVNQVALPGNSDECIAVSQTSDPTGAYYLYDFVVFNGFVALNPKVGVWPGAYYASSNTFNGDGSLFLGASFEAFERQAMLNGDANAHMVVFRGTGADLAYSLLPADLDGTALPPEGAPGIFMDYVSPALWGSGAPYALAMWQMHVDWSEPADSTLSGPTELDVAPFNDNLCDFSAACIPEPNPGEGLAALSDSLMFRLAYRNDVGADAHQALVMNQTVAVSGTNPPAGIRWYELEAPAASTAAANWTVAQQGTYAPDDGASRWMGSIAMDRSGDIALGYSLSSATINPSVAFTGRLPGDPSGEMTVPETTLVSGGGVQTSGGDLWGDYSSMVLDPTDDCTFWYAQEYYATTSFFNWSTRLAAFKFPGCTPTPRGTLSGSVTDAATGDPVAGAIVSVTADQIVTIAGQNGDYTLPLAPGGYTVSASKPGYLQESASVTISNGQSTAEDFALQAGPTATVSGTVTDASHGYGQYAEVKATTPVFGLMGDVWTDPLTGDYSMVLPEGSNYTLDVLPYLGGFEAGRAAIADLSGDAVRNVALTAGPSCTAQGYNHHGFGEDFDAGFPPVGWTVTNAIAGSPVVWNTNEYWGDYNYASGDGMSATADGGAAAFLLKYEGPFNTSLVTPPITVSSLPPDPVLQFALNFQQSPTTALEVGISYDGGNTWTTLAQFAGSYGNFYGPTGTTYRIPLNIPQGVASFNLRWRYDKTASTGLSWYVQIDNVSFGNCYPLPGGLVVGQVAYNPSGDGAVDATVSDNNSPADHTLTFQNRPADPTLPVGFYALFADTSNNTHLVLTASDSGVNSETAEVDVTPGAITEQNFKLGIAHLSATPGSFNLHVPVNARVTKTVAIKNDGAGTGRFHLLTSLVPASTSASTVLSASMQRVAIPLKLIHCKHLSPLSLGAQSDPHCKATVTEADHAAASVAYDNSPWVRIANYPASVMDNAVAEDDATGDVYSVEGNSSSNAYVYLPLSNIWQRIADFPNVLEEESVAAFTNDKFYVAFGWLLRDSVMVPNAQLYIYDPVANTWNTGAPAPASEGEGVSAAVLNNKIYFVGGCRSTSVCGDTTVQVYDPASKAWSAAAPYPHPVSWASCGAVLGKLYCVGGTAGDAAYADGYVYNPASNSWSPIAPIPVASGGLWGSGYTGSPEGLVVSGGVTENSTTITNQGFLYSPSTNSWSALPNALETVYRGGSSCGFYRIGGSIRGSSTPVTSAEYLPGFGACGNDRIPWLTLSPASGTVAINGSVPVRLTFNGTDQQPGTTAQADVVVAGKWAYAPQHIPLTVHWDALPVDLSVSVSANRASVYKGDEIAYAVTVSNLNAANHGAANKTMLTATFPADVNDVTASGPATCMDKDGTYTCDFGTLALGENESETLKVKTTQTGTVTSTFSVTSQETDSDPSNNSVNESTKVQAGGGSSGGGGGGGGLGWEVFVLLAGLIALGCARRKRTPHL
ncbi:MAG: carboxypeptidase regulatory-like domain-containing protein [Terriglobia bacterium]